MSGFSGILVFDSNLKGKLKRFKFPGDLNGFYPKLGQVEDHSLKIAYYSNHKFLNDSFLKERNNRIIGINGVILKAEFDICQASSPEEFIRFTSTTKGSFASIFKDHNTDKLILQTDQTGSRQVFYYWGPGFVAFSSSIFLLTDILKHFNISISISEPASYMMLSLGYMLEDFTLVSEIRKIKAGHYIEVTKQGVKTEKYHDYYREVAYNHVTKDLLAELDWRFKRSLILEYEKDKSCNYDHLATLSGGLDSRLNVMLAHEYDYKDITCLTFSDGLKPDELTARKISLDLSLKHIILVLNNGFQLYDINTPLILNNCSVYYFGAAQTLAAVRGMNFANYGLLHNGGLAESSKGGYLSGKNHRVPCLDKRYAVSDKLFARIDNQILKEAFSNYPNEEMFITYNRGFNAINNGLWMTMPITDSVSTYMDYDFADLAYTVHPKLRYNGYLAIEWINKHHPNLTRYAYKYGIRPTNQKYKILTAKAVNKLIEKILKRTNASIPLSKWGNDDKGLREFVNIQYNQSPAWSQLSHGLKKDIGLLFENSRFEEKLLCISFLKSIELLFATNSLNE